MDLDSKCQVNRLAPSQPSHRPFLRCVGDDLKPQIGVLVASQESASSLVTVDTTNIELGNVLLVGLNLGASDDPKAIHPKDWYPLVLAGVDEANGIDWLEQKDAAAEKPDILKAPLNLG